LSAFRPWAVPRMSGGPAPSRGLFLRNLEGLIRAAQEELKAFHEGRTSFIGYITNLREHMVHCLADIGEVAQEELRELATMDLSISPELAAWYAKDVHNDFQVKEGDNPADFLRAQAEYDRTMPAKIQRMIDLLERVRGKVLGIGLEPTQSAPVQAEATVEHSEPAQLPIQAPSREPVLTPTEPPPPNSAPIQPAVVSGSERPASKDVLIRPFATPEGCTWPDIQVRFTSDFEVQISARDHTEVKNCGEMGFEDRRGRGHRKPDGNWEVLRRFAELSGAIQSTQQASDWRKLEKRVQTINVRLRMLFGLGLSENGIVYDRQTKAYRTRFRITPPPDFDRTADEA
jgi:hypothetical protein